MSYRYWVATTAKLWSDTSAWSTTSGGAGGASAPGYGDFAIFDGAGGAGGDCTLDANVLVSSINATTGYSGTINLAGYNLDNGSGGAGFTFAHTGNLDFGAGVISPNYHLVYSGVGGSILGTPTFQFYNSIPCTWTPKSHYTVYGIDVPAGATVTLTAGRIDVPQGTLDVAGTLLVNGTLYPRDNVAFSCLATGRVGGTGTLGIISPTAGKGLVEKSGAIDVATFLLQYWSAGAGTLPVGTYESALVRFYQPNVAGDHTFTLAAGQFTFQGDVTFDHDGSGTVTLANSAGGPSITVQGTLTFDLSGSGDLVVDDTGQTVDWALEGDATYLQTSTGAVVWNPGTGAVIATGSADVRWNLGAAAASVAVEINKTLGTLTLDGDLDVGSLDHQAGTLDPNGQTITTTGDCSVQPGAMLTNLDGSTWIVGGGLDWQGAAGNLLALDPPTAWTLTVTGAAVVHYVEVAQSDARGGTMIDASDGTNVDGGGNRNWWFGGLIGPATVAASAVTLAGGRVGEVFLAGQQAGRTHG